MTQRQSARCTPGSALGTYHERQKERIGWQEARVAAARRSALINPDPRRLHPGAVDGVVAPERGVDVGGPARSRPEGEPARGDSHLSENNSRTKPTCR